MNRIIVSVVVVASLMSCRPHCNLRLYIPTLTFELPETEATQFAAGSSTVRTCLNDECWDGDFAGTDTQRIRWDASTRRLSVDQWRTIDGASTSVPAGPKNDVSLTVIRAGNTLFSHEWKDVTFDESEPNGAGCGVQYSTGVLTF